MRPRVFKSGGRWLISCRKPGLPIPVICFSAPTLVMAMEWAPAVAENFHMAIGKLGAE